jgi:hypothetical protein
MFGNKENERGNGIHQPPWNATLFSLLKWEIRKRYRTIGIKAPETSRGFAVYVHEITKVWQCTGKAVNLPVVER